MIETIDLTKQFDAFTAVDTLSIEVKEGHLLALLGPNGAGKTTTVRMLSALLQPTRGQAFVNGRDVVKLRAAAETLRGEGADVHELAFDATDNSAAKAAVDKYEAEVGPIDILVNNAGMQHRTPLEDFPPDMFEKLLRTNISTVFNVGQACARHMIERGAGRIINIASVQTALARPGIATLVDAFGFR